VRLYVHYPNLNPPGGAGLVAESARPLVSMFGTLAVTSASIGGAWDVSWHRSIGRDSFWTPAHMAIYACGVLAGIIGLWLTARSTFGSDREIDDTQRSAAELGR